MQRTWRQRKQPPARRLRQPPSLKPEEELYLERFGRLRGILDGTMSISYYLEFLYSHNHADLQVGPLQPTLANTNLCVGACAALLLREVL